MTTDERTAVREALEGIDQAVRAAAARRAHLVREIAAMAPPPALAADHRNLAEALLRREAADTDETQDPLVRASHVLNEAIHARNARLSLHQHATAPADQQYARAVEAKVTELDQTWHWALDQAKQYALGLNGRARQEVTVALTAYVRAFRGVLEASETLDPTRIRAAVQVAEEASRHLEATLA